MRNRRRYDVRRLAAACLILGVFAAFSAQSYAVQLAYDDATHAAYADGWQGKTTNNETGAVESVGDNGGFGFEPWDFDTDWLFNPDPLPGIQDVDTLPFNEFNQIGTAWRMGLPMPEGNPPNNGLPRAGRGFPALQVGQTFRVVFDNPTEQLYFKGYFIRFNSRLGEGGGGNICYEFPGYSTACSAANEIPIDAEPVPKLTFSRFEYEGEPGIWGIDDGDESTPFEIPLFDVDTAAAGAQLDFTLTGPDTYSLTIDPFGPAATHTQTGTLLTPGEPIDWIEFTFFNTLSEEGFETDLFIKSLEIIGEAPGTAGDYNSDGTVNAADYTLWRDKLGQTFQLANEVAGVTPGMVTVEDYDAWRIRFANTSGAGAGDSAVPEPTTFAYLVAAAAGVVALGRRGTWRSI